MPSSPSPLSNLCSGESKNKAALRARLRARRDAEAERLRQVLSQRGEERMAGL